MKNILLRHFLFGKGKKGERQWGGGERRGWTKGRQTDKKCEKTENLYRL